MQPEGIRKLVERADRAIAEEDTDVDTLERLLDDLATVVGSLERETTRLHRAIERALDIEPAAVAPITRDLRECYRDLELLRPRLRAVQLREDEFKAAQDE